MIILSGADLVLPNRVLGPGTLVIEADRITEIRDGSMAPAPPAAHVDLHGCYVLPGFIDVHVHGIDGRDVLDGPGAVRAVAARLPKAGVTAFCPTTVACAPASVRAVLAAVRDARVAPDHGAARVLPAHLESNFLSPEYRGAQPLDCLRLPPSGKAGGACDRRSDAAAGRPAETEPAAAATEAPGPSGAFTGADIAAEIERGAQDVGIVTIAPEIDHALPFIRTLAGRGLRVSLGHSGASLEIGAAAIAAGARGGTHLFNRMPPLRHREPGLAGAILESDEVAAELVCDGFHVHPAMMRIAIAAKGPERMMAITDGTAGAGRPVGSRALLGDRPITVRDTAAFLDDDTLAGSTLTMDRAFRILVGPVGLGLVEAAILCSTTPAREMGLVGFGALAVGAVADLVVLDRSLQVVRTYVGGELVHIA